MASMTDLGPKHTLRIAAVGDPGTGKSGAIASVINTGRYNLRIIDLDGNTEPLFQFIDREHWGKVDIQPVEEPLYLPGATDIIKDGPHAGQPTKITDQVKAKGAPRAFRRVWQLIEDWPGFGPVKDWSNDTILMVDSASPLSRAIERKVRHISGTPTGEKDWKDQVAHNSDFLGLFERLKSRTMTPCHLYVTFHRKLIGPKELEADTKANKTPEVNKTIREKAADLTPTKFYPYALGREGPTLVGGLFSTLLLFETIYRGKEHRRVIRTVPVADMDVKLPARGLPDVLPLATGMLTIFNALTNGGQDGAA